MTNPWLSRRVLAFAHQGGAKEAPSSTLFACSRAVELGADVLELDVHASADGVLVVTHDETVDRTSSGSGRIAQLDMAALAELDNAYWFVPGEGTLPDAPPAAYPYRGRAPGDRRFGVASLAEVLEDFPATLLNLDVKEGPPAVEAYESELAALLQAHGRADDVIVTSFDDHRIARLRMAAPKIGTAPGTSALTAWIQAVRTGEEPPEVLLEGAVAIQVPHRVAGIDLVDERLVEAAHRAGRALHVWTVDEESEMERLVALGVDGIMTDRPSVLVGLLSRLGVRYGGSSARSA